MKNYIFNSLFLACLVLIISCSGKTNSNSNTSTPTSGTTTIAVDETLYPIIKAEKEVFEAIYDQAKINILVLSEREAFVALEKGKVDLVIAARKLTASQENYFKQKTVFPKHNAIAVDAIAVIVNPSNPDSTFLVDDLKNIITGKFKNWNELMPKNNLGKINIVFDNFNSGIVRYLLDSIGNGEKFLSNMTNSKSNENVIKEVAKNKNSIGFIGANWISDHDDSTAMTFLKEIRVAYLSPQDGMEFVQPYQAYLAINQYPIARKIYTICTEPKSGLATGFVSFLASDRGQRIILKSGILPITAPIRILNVKNEM
ncbi:MAG: substrate-binding domain-containing protein [Bacteroidota bacterium]